MHTTHTHTHTHVMNFNTISHQYGRLEIETSHEDIGDKIFPTERQLWASRKTYLKIIPPFLLV